MSDPFTPADTRSLLCEGRLDAILNGTTEQAVQSTPRDAAEFGTKTGVVVAVLMNVIFSFKDIFSKKFTRNVRGASGFINARTISLTVILTTLLISLPILILLLISASIYKFTCIQLIKRHDSRYAGALESFDVFWSLEDDSSKSIINVIGIVESESPQYLLSNIKEKLETIFNDKNKCMEKIFFRKTEEFGFYYWRRYSNIDLNEYVRVIEASNDNDKLNVRDLEELMADHSEKPLPYDNEGLFQILITRRPVHVKESKINPTYGIIIKIHHSLGDGIALLDFLCQNLSEENPDSTAFYALRKRKPNASTNLTSKLHALIQMPICFAKGIIKKPYENALHGPELTGDKLFVWTHSEENLLQILKEIKRTLNGVNYTDILVTALSAGLRSYFMQRMTKLPEDVSVILPIRLPEDGTDGRLKLENSFSVSILDVPIQRSPSAENLNAVKTRCDKLRSSADPITNYYFLKLVCEVLPSQILKPMLTSRQATLVLSNLPGPDALKICGGNMLKQLVFFVPNKGTTGVGVTALSYGGVLRLAAAADRALVSSADELRLILDGMVEEIRRLHRAHCSQ